MQDRETQPLGFSPAVSRGDNNTLEQAEADDGKFVVNYLEGRASRSARGKGGGGGQAQLCREGAVPSCPPGGSRGCLRGGPIWRPRAGK